MRKIQFIKTLVGLSAFLFLLACNKNTPTNNQLESINEYVYAYTSGELSRAANLTVRFAQPMIAEDQIGESVNPSVLQLQPSAKGTLRWENPTTLIFEPSEWLQPNTPYVATVDLGKINSEVPAKARTFKFDFKTKELYFEVNTKSLQPIDLADLTKQTLQGEVVTSDVVTTEQVKQLLVVKQGGKNLEIDWTDNNGGSTIHQFTVANIVRNNAPSAVEINYDGKALGLTKVASKRIDVPAIDDFKLMDMIVVQDAEQYILMTFSDPLMREQNFKGLVRASDYTNDFRYVVDGTQLRVYPENRLSGERKITVAKAIKNTANQRMQSSGNWSLLFEAAKPKVRLAGKGVIMPTSEGLILPFDAVGLNAVEVEVFKIFNNNILQFLQTNELDDSRELERVGRIVGREKVDLKNLNAGSNSSNWTRYALDLGTMIKADPNSVYQVRIGFRPAYTSLPCISTAENTDAEVQDTDGNFVSFYDDWYGIEGYYEDYNWEHRQDPCEMGYYAQHNFVRTNIIASNLGIIAKGGNNNDYFVAITDLRSTKAIGGTNLNFYDYQQQLIKTVQTDASGVANVDLPRRAYMLVAEKGEEKGYLKLGDGNALSLSRFDVGGASMQKGLKGYIYGERGVWRPGDTLFLNFVLEDKTKTLPVNHPITFELLDARGQTYLKRTTANHVGNIYPLTVTTSPDVATGNWLAKVKVGGATFDKSLKVETVKPNRLKVNLDFGKEALSMRDEPVNADLSVRWLHGAPAQNLETTIELQMRPMPTQFDDFTEYTFDDPARQFGETEPRVIFDKAVNAEGKAKVVSKLFSSGQAPGKLMANFKVRAFEKGGDFSTITQRVPYSPYSTYTGLYVPENKYGEKRIEVGKMGQIDVAAVDENGKGMSNRTLTVGLYRVDWRWWWDRSQDNVGRYNSSKHFGALKTGTVKTNNKGEAAWNIEVEDWGRYMVRVCDNQSGHCSGDFFYAGYPWYDEEGEVDRKAAAMMAFSSDKKSYRTGETIELNIPATELSRVLITMENGKDVIESRWEDAQKGDNTYRFTATAEMSPTVYAHVALIQPHAQTNNDLPIRMYGVIPINVEDPYTILNPEIAMPKELKPEQSVTIKVSEASGEPMAYTVAMVDEGLLDLTGFPTPDLHAAFYAREALGVKTWDVYDYVLGAYGGELERILSMGGDAELMAGKKNRQLTVLNLLYKTLDHFI